MRTGSANLQNLLPGEGMCFRLTLPLPCRRPALPVLGPEGGQLHAPRRRHARAPLGLALNLLPQAGAEERLEAGGQLVKLQVGLRRVLGGAEVGKGGRGEERRGSCGAEGGRERGEGGEERVKRAHTTASLEHFSAAHCLR